MNEPRSIGGLRLQRYGVILESVRPQDLEMIRRWRNSPRIANTMIFREQISREQQILWFNNLDKTKNIYLLVLVETRPVGLINLKNIDHAAGTAEAGLFIYDLDEQNSLISYAATLNLLDYAFITLGLNTIHATNRTDNPRALRYNQSLGYEIKADDGVALRLELQAAAYFKAKQTIEKYLTSGSTERAS